MTIALTPAVGPNGVSFFLFCSLPDGSPSFGNGANLTGPTVVTPPTVTLNAVPVTLGIPVSYADFVMWPLPVTVGPTDSLHASALAGAIVTGDGSSPVLSAVAPAPAALLPAFQAVPKSMLSGWNAATPDSLNPCPTYNNLFMHGQWAIGNNATGYTADSNNEITAIAGSGTVVVYAQFAGAASPNGYSLPGSGANSGYPSMRPGTYTLKWDGSSATVALMAADGVSTVAQQSSTITNTTNNTVVYTVTGVSSQFWIGLNLTITQAAGSCNAHNIRVYGPTSDVTGASLFHSDMLAKLRGTNLIRMVNSLGINSCNRVNYSDCTPTTGVFRSGVRSSIGFTVNHVANYSAGDGAYASSQFGNSAALLFTTSSAHGLTEGQTVQLTGAALGTLTWTDGVNSRAAGIGGTVHLPSASTTTFSLICYGPGVSLASGQNLSGVTGAMAIQDCMPIADCCALCNQIGAHLWVNIPHLATDSYVSSMMADVWAHLNAGLRCYVEDSNELWNFNIAFQQAIWNETQAGLSGVDGPTQQAIRFKHRMSLCSAASATAGRSADLVRVLGGFQASVARTTTMVNWLAANSGAVDRLCIALYYNGTAQTAPDSTDRTAALTAMTVPQHEDLESVYCQRDPENNTVAAAHRAILQSAFPAARVNVYEWSYATPVTAGPNIDAKARAMTRRPMAAAMQLHLCDSYQGQGVAEACLFAVSTPNGTYGSYYAAIFNHYYGAATVPGIGDGSDGLNDNRGNAENLPALVSPTAYAANRWTSLVGAVAPMGGGSVRGRRSEGGRAGSRKAG